MIVPDVRTSLRYAGGFLLFAAIYVVAGRLGFAASAVHPVVSSAWPPSGIALAALLLVGFRFWPAITLGAFIVNVTHGISPLASSAIAVGNTLEAVTAAWLLTGLAGFQPSLERLRDVLSLTVFGAIGSTAIAATIGTAALTLSGAAPVDSASTIWFAWYTGDAIGILIVTTFILAWSTGAGPGSTKRSPGEAIILGVVLIGSTIPLFQTPFSYVYAIFPVTIWAAIRFGPRGAATTK